MGQVAGNRVFRLAAFAKHGLEMTDSLRRHFCQASRLENLRNEPKHAPNFAPCPIGEPRQRFTVVAFREFVPRHLRRALVPAFA